MAVRIVWKGYHPLIQRFVMIWNAYGPLTAFDRLEYEQMRKIMNIAFPRFSWAWWSKGEEWIYQAVQKRIRGQPLNTEEQEIIEEIEGIHVPDYVEMIARSAEEDIRRGWIRITRAFDEVTSKVYGPHASFGELSVYTAVKLGRGAEGTTTPAGEIVIMVGMDKNSGRAAGTRVLPHEIIHVLNKKSGLSNILAKIKAKTGQNAEEAFTNTITNLVLWRAGVQESMFEGYYQPSWEDLCKLEDRMREIVKEWWLNGGDLAKMLEGMLAR